MIIFRRLKNLWRISAYRMDERLDSGKTQFLIKDFPTIKKKLATIIEEDKPDIFTQEKNAQRNTV